MGQYHLTEVGEEEHCGPRGLCKVLLLLSTYTLVRPVLGALGFRTDNFCLWSLSLLN